MSSENTPILCGAIPAFETFMTAWEKVTHTPMKKYAKPGLDCTYQYYGRMDRTHAYVVTMCKWVCLRAFDYLTNSHLQS